MWALRIALLWSVVFSLQARRLPLKTYTTADGLARDRVQCILQDHHGFLWFCTAEGLSRFDGYRFTNYGTEHGLPANNVIDMVEAPDGTLWVGTPSGLSQFDPTAPGTAKFRKYQLPGGGLAQEIKVLYRDAEGVVWAGTQGGLFRLPKSAATFERVDLDPAARGCPSAWEPSCGSSGIMALREDRRRGLWVGTNAGLFLREPDGRTKHFTSGAFAPKEGPSSILEDRDGMMWFDGSRWRLEGSSTLVEQLVRSPAVPGHLAVFSMAQSSDGRIWLATSSGLAQWVPEARGTSHEFQFYDVNSGMNGQEANVVAEDREGNLWIGTAGGGAMRMAASGIVSYYAQDGLEGRIDTGSIFETRQGELCFLEQASVARFNGIRFVPTRPKWPTDIDYFGWGTNRLALQDRAGDWWLATGRGLIRFPPVPFNRLAQERPKAVYRVANGLPGDNVFQLFEDSRGDIWISIINAPTRDGDGVVVLERATGRIRVFSKDTGFINSPPTGFAEDRAGNIWIGTYHGALARYKDGRFTFFTDRQGMPAGGWKVPYVDSAGRLWIGARRGLGCSENPTADNPKFVTYTTAEGLASNDVKSTVEDRWGNLYAATGRGVDRIRPTPDGIIVTRHYTFADGLASGELSSAYRDRTGSLWFVTTVGISQLTPSPDRRSTTPTVLVTGLHIGTAAHPISEVGQAEVQGPTIRPGDGPLRIDFVGLSFAPGETLRYQYQLQGVDRDWSVPTDQRTVTYGRLAAGTYRFLVRGVNSEGVTSVAPASVAFTMLPPIWLRWWFILAAAVVTAGVIYAAHRYRMNQLLAVERVRSRIATDLHDDIGSSLSQISILSELVRQRLRIGDPHVSQPLAEIALISGELIASLSDIVWAINPKHDRLSDLTARMRRFAWDVLGARGIEVSFTAEDHMEWLHTSSDFRRQVYLIFKEAVNNSVRHAKCSRAAVDLQVEHGYLKVHVGDNGTGFEPSSPANGNGLDNMRRRAADLGGELSVSSQPGRGTELTLSVPLSGSRNR